MADSYTITHSSGPSEPYSRSHLASSLQRAFAHITGSALYVTIDSLADTIENEIIQSAHDAILSSEELGAIAYETLKRYDPVAGVQYAAQNGLVSAVSQRRRGRPSIK